MVKDGFSHSDEGPAVAGHLDRNSNDPLLGSPVGSLAQELAQLLAALIDHNQANKGGAPTNAELTSLANLVSAAGAVRRTIRLRPRRGFRRSLTRSLPPRRHSKPVMTMNRCRCRPPGVSPRREIMIAGSTSKCAPPFWA